MLLENKHYFKTNISEEKKFFGNDLEINLSFYEIYWLSLIRCFMKIHRYIA
jgi:hypothetical protein